MSGRYDAIVVGGGIGGLTASATLAGAGLKTLLLEAGAEAGGAAQEHGLFALDPRVVKTLKLVRHGLRFAARDMPLVGFRPDGKHLIIGRDVHAAMRSIAVHSQSDAKVFAQYRREMFALARALRPWWWEAKESGDPSNVLQNASQRRLFAALKFSSAVSFLDGWFESDGLKALLAFDAAQGGLSPSEAGSALTLVWRAAQETGGLQGAVAVPLGGMKALGEAFLKAARAAGVEIRTEARAAKLALKDGSIDGVELESGEWICASAVLSNISRRATLADLTPTAAAGFDETLRLTQAHPRIGEATAIFTLNAVPGFVGAPASGRLVFGERLETYAAACAASCAGRLPDDLVLEAMFAASDPHTLLVRVAGMPATPNAEWGAHLLERVIAALDRHVPGLKASILSQSLVTPERKDPASVARLLAPSAARIRTPIEGLFLCGRAAEPVDAVSGRAGRLAAAMATEYIARRKGA